LYELPVLLKPIRRDTETNGMGKIFSLCVCGAEQMRRRFFLRGFTLCGIFVSSAGFLAFSFVRPAPDPDPVMVALVFLIAAFVWLYNLLDIVDLARQDRAVDMPGQKKLDDLYEQGRVFLLKGSLDKARECFDALLKARSGDADCVYQLAKIHRDLGNKKESLRLFKRYVKVGDKLEWLEEAKEALTGKSDE
jgi:tetratricopeptide (TPR) repeat protein